MINWEAIGAMGELLGATAVFGSLLFVGWQIKDAGQFITIHIGRLCRGMDLHAIRHRFRITRFRFDIGMFNKTGFEFAVRPIGACRQRRVDVTAFDQAGGQNIPHCMIMNVAARRIQCRVNAVDRGLFGECDG